MRFHPGAGALALLVVAGVGLLFGEKEAVIATAATAGFIAVLWGIIALRRRAHNGRFAEDPV